jgi:hypothetical protein
LNLSPPILWIVGICLTNNKKEGLKMNKALIVAAILICSGATAIEAKSNVFFGEGNISQIGFSGGTGSQEEGDQHGAREFLALHYAQPTEVFRLPARIAIEGAALVGEGVKWNMAGIFWDMAPIKYNRFYLGVGIGGYIRSKITPRLDTKFTFGEKVFAGYRIMDDFSLELFARHISNGTISERNLGYNFFGIEAMTNF